MILGELLRNFRGEMSLREASKKLGVSHTYLQRLENGVDPRTGKPITPSIITLKAIARGYNEPIETLLNCAGYLENINYREGQTSRLSQDKIPMVLNVDSSKVEFHPSFNIQRSQQIIRDARRAEGDPNENIVMIPVLGVIRAGYDLYAEQQVIGLEPVRASDVADGEYFYVQVTGDSMIGDDIREGDRVLVRRQSFVTDGAIGVVIINRDEGTLKRISYRDGLIVLQSSNPQYPIRVLPENEVTIQGQATQLQRDLNLK